MTKKLFTVGPVEVFPDVMQSMCRPMITHRGDDYKRLQRGIVERMRKVLDTDMNILMTGASATGILEACVRSGVRERMLGVSNGSFGDRWASIGTENGKSLKKLDVAFGKAVRGDVVADAMEPGVEAVTIVSCESSAGVLNPIKEIVESIRSKGDPLICVDAVTSATAIDMKLKELDVDAFVFGSQKALALPPGLGIVCVSDNFLKRAASVPNRGFYFDLVAMKAAADKDLALTTPPIGIMFGLDYQLDKILREGMPNRYARHRQMAEAVRAWATKRFRLFAEEGYRSDTINVIESGSMPFADFNKRLKEKGFEVSPGYGKAKETTFRVGTMGDITVKDINDLTRAMDEVLEEMR
ncbi:MAG: alanine--glyoxylate aminotransferase family protein [Methanomassiliicoccales archaeon]